jgi:hypothetical protein
VSMTTDPGDPGRARRRRWRVIAVVGVVLVAAAVSAMALRRGDGDDSTASLTVGWGGSEGHPPCVYKAKDRAVDCELTIDGTASEHEKVTVTVSAYADENTSELVGSSTRSVRVEGTVHKTFAVTIPVDKPPHVDDDGVAACRLSVKY